MNQLTQFAERLCRRSACYEPSQAGPDSLRANSAGRAASCLVLHSSFINRLVRPILALDINHTQIRRSGWSLISSTFGDPVVPHW